MTRQKAGGIRRQYRRLAAGLPRHVGWVLLICLLLIALRIFLMPAITPRYLNVLMDHPMKIDAQWVREDVRVLSEALSSYLASVSPSAQAMVHIDGELAEAFQSHELQHLADVRQLFRLAHSLAAGAVIVFAAISLIILTARTGRLAARFKALATVYQIAALGALGVLALLALVAALWFDQAFYAMHRLLFTNDLWLLDPGKDLLIQLMPERFFVEYAKLGIAPSLRLLGGLLFVSTAVRFSAGLSLKPRGIDA